ncbi:MAG: BspA family leucine-rich repeat surface protein [Clostridia bacterium]
MLKNTKGITLIALVVTIVVLLILAGVSINLVLDNNGIIQKSKEARSETIVADEKSKVEMAYLSAALKKLGDTVTAEELQEELDSSVGAGKTVVTTNGNGTLNVLFNATGHNYNVDEGTVEKVEIDNTKMAMFDTGENVAKKMYALAPDGYMQYNYLINNLSIDGIKKYKGTPDLTIMTEANIVSWAEGYNAYEQNPSAYKSMIPEGTKLCPIYMWFEESGEEIRGMDGSKGLTEITNSNTQKKVKTGTIYWWSESQNVYLNPDSSNMFVGLSYLADISGLSELKTDYVTNMSRMFYWSTHNLTNVNALKNWNTANVEDMNTLFYSWNGDISDISGLKNWNTAKVTDMSSMFVGSRFEDVEALSNWNTSNVTNMSYMFGDGDTGSNIKKIDGITNWDVSKVANMQGMFYTCSITDLSAISKWNVSNVTCMDSMFWGCEIQDLNAISNWNVSNVTSVSQMFQGNPITDASGINNWNITKVTSFNSMFSGCPTHPEFTKVTGTWDSDGTFTPTTE